MEKKKKEKSKKRRNVALSKSKNPLLPLAGSSPPFNRGLIVWEKISVI